MATRRGPINDPVQDLESMCKSYLDLKSQESVLKKSVDKFNTSIKAEMKRQDITEAVFDEVKALISITPREDFNELQAIEILRENLKEDPELFSKVVKTREYIDDDAFESAVYNRQIDAAILAPARTPKEPTITLRVTVVK